MYHFDTKEVIEIESCPECKKKHSYKLEISKYLVPTYMAENEFGAKPIIKEKTLTFTCPNTKKDYEASCKLKETSMEKINEVKVSGPAD